MAAFVSLLFGNNSKTFKPLKSHQKETHAKLHEFCKTTLGGGDLKNAVILPPGEDLNEWFAVNTVDFFNEISLLYGNISESCTPSTCPVMSAGGKFEYLWADGVDIIKPIKLSAPEYVDHLMTWIERQINNEKIFPVSEGAKFPKTFDKTVSTIFKSILINLFIVDGHIYHSHFPKIASIGAEAHLNTCFKHFILFVFEFNLIDQGELEPLRDVIATLTSN